MLAQNHTQDFGLCPISIYLTSDPACDLISFLILSTNCNHILFSISVMICLTKSMIVTLAVVYCMMSAGI